MARVLDASLTNSVDESLFVYAEILSPLWANRFTTSFLGIYIPLPGSLQLSDGSFAAFTTTTQLVATPMYEDPGGVLPEPAAFTLTGIVLFGAFFLQQRNSRRLSD
jgi:hypothetical protein